MWGTLLVEWAISVFPPLPLLLLSFFLLPSRYSLFSFRWIRARSECLSICTHSCGRLMGEGSVRLLLQGYSCSSCSCCSDPSDLWAMRNGVSNQRGSGANKGNRVRLFVYTIRQWWAWWIDRVIQFDIEGRSEGQSGITLAAESRRERIFVCFERRKQAVPSFII